MKWQIEASTAIFFTLKTHRCKISMFPKTPYSPCYYLIEAYVPVALTVTPKKYNREINALVDEVEGLSEVRKHFYKVMLQQRYKKILVLL